MAKKRTYYFIALIAFLLFSAGCDDQAKRTAASAPGSSAGAGPAQIASAQTQFIAIEAVAISRDADSLEFPGRVTFRPQAQSAAGATVAGRVAAVLVQAGQVVREGAPLLAIDSADAAAARAALDQAGTRLLAAENVFRRQVEMVKKGVGLEIERQEAETRLTEARAEQERARHAADMIGVGQGIRVTVRAPVNGVVMGIRTTVGAMVAPGGEPLIELGDPVQLQVVAQVPEGDLRRIVVGQRAEVELPALATRVDARVESFNPRVDVESRRMQVYLALSRRVDGLRAGMLAQVALRVGADAGIALPVTAVLIKDGKRRVVYVERPDGKFEAREVQTGRNRDGRVVILQGLAAGERVVVRGALLLDSQAAQLL